MVLTHILRRTGKPFIAGLIRLQTSSPNVKGFFHHTKEGIMMVMMRTRMGSSLAFAPSKVFPSDDNLVRLLQSEIKFEMDNDPPAHVHHDDIPFSVRDKPREQWMALHRKYGKEDIKVEATMIDLGTCTADHYVEEVGEDETSCTIALAITISKGEGAPVMVIGCSVHPDEIIIDTVSVTEDESSDRQFYEPPDFKEMSEDLQNAFKGYLEERGINSNLSNFLYDLMLNKSKEEYLRWLQTVKYFIENQTEI